MAAIGDGWETDAWIQASWITGAWLVVVIAAIRSVIYRKGPMSPNALLTKV